VAARRAVPGGGVRSGRWLSVGVARRAPFTGTRRSCRLIGAGDVVDHLVERAADGVRHRRSRRPDPYRRSGCGGGCCRTVGAAGSLDDRLAVLKSSGVVSIVSFNGELAPIPMQAADSWIGPDWVQYKDVQASVVSYPFDLQRGFQGGRGRYDGGVHGAGRDAARRIRWRSLLLPIMARSTALRTAGRVIAGGP